jgi:acyl carrier protein
MSIQEAVREYVLNNFLFTNDQSQLRNDASFLEEGIIDSTGVLELVMFVEEQFGFAVEDDEILPQNFDSVEGLVRYVHEKNGKVISDAR